MSRIIVLDPGHGGSDPGACANNLRESAITLSVCNLMKAELERHGFVVKFTRTSDTYLSLSERAKIANNLGAALFVSNHCNSATAASATGVECYTHPTENGSVDKLSANVSEKIAKVLGLRNRGAKEANFAVLRETKMPAILVENAFISNSSDANLLKNKQQVFADAIVEAILEYFGIKCTGHSTPQTPQTTQPVTFYRVVVGSYLDKAKASEVEAKLDKAGYSAFLDAFQKDGKTYYRVIAGSYSVKKNAEEIKAKLEKENYTGVFLVAFTKNTNTTTSSSSSQTSKPVTPSKQYLNLPPSATSWNVYPLTKAPVKGNECGKLNPSKFGGLSYEILNTPQANVYTIQTSNFGKVNIYGAVSTGAVISTSPKY